MLFVYKKLAGDGSSLCVCSGVFVFWVVFFLHLPFRSVIRFNLAPDLRTFMVWIILFPFIVVARTLPPNNHNLPPILTLTWGCICRTHPSAYSVLPPRSLWEASCSGPLSYTHAVHTLCHYHTLGWGRVRIVMMPFPFTIKLYATVYESPTSVGEHYLCLGDLFQTQKLVWIHKPQSEPCIV